MFFEKFCVLALEGCVRQEMVDIFGISIVRVQTVSLKLCGGNFCL